MKKIKTVKQFLEAAKTTEFHVVVDNDSVKAYADNPEDQEETIEAFDFGDHGPQNVLIALFTALGITAEKP